MFRSNASKRISASQNSAHQCPIQDVTAARARAQRAKLDEQTQARETTRQSKKQTLGVAQEGDQTSIRIVEAIDAYLQDHEGAITVTKRWSGIASRLACSAGTSKRSGP